MVVFNTAYKGPHYGGVHIIGIRNNELFMGLENYHQILIMKRNLYETTTEPIIISEDNVDFDRICCNTIAIFCMSACKNYIFTIFSDGRKPRLLMRVTLDNGKRDICRLNFVGGLAPCGCRFSTMQHFSNGKILIMNKSNKSWPTSTYLEIVPEDSQNFQYKATCHELTFRNISVGSTGIHHPTFHSNMIPVLCLDEHAKTWLIIDDHAHVFLYKDNQGILLKPSPMFDSEFVHSLGHHTSDRGRSLFLDNGRVYYLISSRVHDFFELVIDEKESAYTAIRVGHIDDMHTEVHCKTLITNGLFISTFNNITMYGFFRVPRLSELAFMKIQKLTGAEMRGGYGRRYVGYDGGWTEEKIKKMLGLATESRLLKIMNS